MSAGHEQPKTPAEEIAAHKWVFAGVFLGVFAVSFFTLSAVGMVPSALSTFTTPFAQSVSTSTPDDTNYAPAGSGEVPLRVEIPKAGVNVSVSSPKGTDIATLDNALLTGAVQYPGTANLGEKGTVLLFGHSSHLPVVHNQAYKAFNDIQNLKEGDIITVYGAHHAYAYAVEKVQEENTSTGEIPLVTNEAHLTLATCDNFGTKADRFIVDAKLVSTTQI